MNLNRKIKYSLHDNYLCREEKRKQSEYSLCSLRIEETNNRKQSMIK